MSLFEDLKEGLRDAIEFEQGKRQLRTKPLDLNRFPVNNKTSALINVIKLQYACRVKAGIMRPKKPNRNARVKNMSVRPKLDYACGLPDDLVTERFKEAVRRSIAENKEKGLPIAMYDKQSRKAYLLHSDGRKEYFEQ